VARAGRGSPDDTDKVTQHRVTETDGVQIAHETFGSPLDLPVVLIMGLGAQMIGWHEDFCHLVVRDGHFVIRFDHRDIGLSTHLEARFSWSGARSCRAPAGSPRAAHRRLPGDRCG
jgi:pimeloyl-ACP methyl ester carboxylesterase